VVGGGAGEAPEEVCHGRTGKHTLCVLAMNARLQLMYG
jgi:hypothetical protein